MAAAGSSLEHREPARHLPPRPTAARTGSSSSRRRTTRPAGSTSRSTPRTTTASSRRCGTTSATTARASTAASAPGCTAPTTAATRGRGSRTSSARRTATTRAAPACRAIASLGRIGVARRAVRPGSRLRRLRHPVRARTRASGSRTTAATRSSPPAGPAPPAATSGGSAAIWVDPQNEDHVFTPTSACASRTTAARRGTTSSGLHADQHAMAVGPERRRTASTSGTTAACTAPTTNGASGTWAHASYEPWNQSYHLAVAAGRPDAARDRPPGQRQCPHLDADLAAFRPRAVDRLRRRRRAQRPDRPERPRRLLRVLRRSGTAAARGHRRRRPALPLRPEALRPVHDRRADRLDPTDPHVVYFGGNVLDRSTDRGSTFTAISPPGDDLTGPVPPDENDLGPFYANQYATISAIAPAKTEPNTIYVGTDTGRLWKTTDLGAHWTELPAGPAGALGQRDRGRPGRRRTTPTPRSPGFREGDDAAERLRDHRRRRRAGTTSAATCRTGRSR